MWNELHMPRYLCGLIDVWNDRAARLENSDASLCIVHEACGRTHSVAVAMCALTPCAPVPARSQQAVAEQVYALQNEYDEIGEHVRA